MFEREGPKRQSTINNLNDIIKQEKNTVLKKDLFNFDIIQISDGFFEDLPFYEYLQHQFKLLLNTSKV